MYYLSTLYPPLLQRRGGMGYKRGEASLCLSFMIFFFKEGRIGSEVA